MASDMVRGGSNLVGSDLGCEDWEEVASTRSTKMPETMTSVSLVPQSCSTMVEEEHVSVGRRPGRPRDPGGHQASPTPTPHKLTLMRFHHSRENMGGTGSPPQAEAP